MMATSILAGVLAVAAGRLILWTSLGRLRACACTLTAIQNDDETVDYSPAPLGLSCRGDVVVRHARRSTLQPSLLRRLRDMDPPQAVAALRAEGFEADLIPGWRSHDR